MSAAEPGRVLEGDVRLQINALVGESSVDVLWVASVPVNGITYAMQARCPVEALRKLGEHLRVRVLLSERLIEAGLAAPPFPKPPGGVE